MFPGKQGKDVGVWTPRSVEYAWNNQQLLKDCGLIPYMFHKVYGYTATMLGCNAGDYPYLDALPGLRLEFLPDCNSRQEHLTVNLQFLQEHYNKIDILVLHGPYLYFNNPYLRIYRSLRPDGKVVLQLDANSQWMDRTCWTNPDFQYMLDQCDVIAASCRKMQQHLNKKWPRWTIDYIPNGFYNTSGQIINVTYEQKENILLTVGRIGIKEKQNNVLMEAFAKVYKELVGWNVHLVGAIDDGFKQYIDDYFTRNPELTSRVIFKGLVEKKIELFAEYARAKIFVLTSHMEGGTPNVIAEALYHGCYQITSEIDACDDITNNGDIGKCFPISNKSTDALADLLLEVCSDEALISGAFLRTLSYAHNNYDYELIIKRLHHLLFL